MLMCSREEARQAQKHGRRMGRVTGCCYRLLSAGSRCSRLTGSVPDAHVETIQGLTGSGC